MAVLVPTVFVASLLGSLHCAGMCGALVAFACGSPGGSCTASVWAYNLARGVGYVLLGIVAGSLGRVLDLGAGQVGLPRIATLVAGSLMIAFGVVALLRWRGIRIRPTHAPKWVGRFRNWAHSAARSLEPQPRAAAMGLLTALLPCGWLYAFVASAAGTGSPLLGGAVMAAFWLGSVPILAGLGLGAQALTARLGAKLPLATALLMVALGLWTVAGRLRMPAMPAMQPAATTAANTAAVPDPDTPLPCCAVDED